MKMSLKQNILAAIQLFVYIHSTCLFAGAEPSNSVTNERPGGILKPTDGEVDSTVTITQLSNLHAESSSKAGWSPSTVSLPQTSYRDLSLEGNILENETNKENVPSPDVEELMNQNETKEFLNSIKNDVKRKVITEQLRHCPYSELCTFSFNLSLPKGNVSACATCSCTKNSKYKMCPDVLDFDSFGVIRVEPFDCFSMTLKPLKDEPLNSGKPKYNATYKCPGADGEIDSCVSMKEDKTFTDILPVTDRTTNITYVNALCAVCNAVDKDNLILWGIQMACEERELQVYKTETELIKFNEEKQSCNLKYTFEKSEGVKANVCPVIRKCNESGHWKTFDPFISSACAFYENRYSIEVKLGTPRFIYRNIFCALCNGVVPSVYTVLDREKIWLNPSDIYSFSGLISFASRDEQMVEPKTGCDSGLIFDVVKRRCVQLLCAPLRQLQVDKCEPIYKEIAGVVYIFTARLYPTEFQNIVIEHLIFQHFESLFRSTFFQGYRIQKDDYIKHTSFCHLGIESVNTTVCTTTGLNSVGCSLKVEYYELELHIAVTQYHRLSEIHDRYMNMTRTQPIMGVTLGDSTFYFIIKPQQLHNSQLDPFVQSECPPKAERINLAHQTSCQLVELAVNDYRWLEEDDSIVFLNTPYAVALNKSEVIFNSNRTSILICFDVYTKYFPAMTLALMSTEDFTFESILSLVCVSLSILCLLVSFVTFCTYSSLRTLPGKNNMALIMCLICAQTLFLVGSFSRFEQESTVCISIGLLTHFFWLMSVFWMNSCTVHVFRVFIGTEGLGTGRGLKTFLTYWSYTVISSATFVLVNLCMSLSKSDYTEFGYGKMSCYINSEKMVAFTFGVPVGFVIIINMVLFCSVVRKIINMPKIKKDIRHERNDVVIFAKLSSLTGCCWIFGFVYSWTDIQIFSYLFIVLNASQGVFIFLSFVCTKRVLKMYKENISAILTRAGSFYKNNR